MGSLNWNSVFDKVYVLETEWDSPVVQRIIKHFDSEKVERVQEEPLSQVKGRLSPQEFDRSKRLLYLAPFKGQFFKRCPGARPGLTCCNYFVLNLGLQCNMNCSYCYLQSFINSPVTKIYTNLHQALDELRQMGQTMRGSALRIGTGEVIDSLSLDPLTLYSHDLIEFFRDYPNWKLEFKTKSALVDQFIDVPHAANVIASWSINPQNIIEKEEHGTASLNERLEAASRCRDAGFPIAFHIDPMIYHADWKDSYAELVTQITRRFTPKDVPVMSVGTLRFQPEQRHMMRERFGMQSLVTSAEMFIGKDGKMRYDQTVRESMYRFLLKRFKDRDPSWNIFMCMESPETWIQSAGALPKNDEGLRQMFDHSVIRKAKQSLKADRIT